MTPSLLHRVYRLLPPGLFRPPLCLQQTGRTTERLSPNIGAASTTGLKRHRFLPLPAEGTPVLVNTFPVSETTGSMTGLPSLSPFSVPQGSELPIWAEHQAGGAAALPWAMQFALSPIEVEPTGFLFRSVTPAAEKVSGQGELLSAFLKKPGASLLHP